MELGLKRKSHLVFFDYFEKYRESFKHLHFGEKISIHFLFSEMLIFLQNSSFFLAAQLICLTAHIFAKTFFKGEGRIFSRKCLLKQMFSRNISQKPASSKYIHKNGLFFHMLLTRFTFFVNNLRKSQHLLIFATMFAKVRKFSSFSYVRKQFPRK
jgi:hypothetical protein